MSATDSLSAAARERLLSFPHEPLFVADWEQALMIHYEVDAGELQRAVPFQLDLFDSRAFVSLVAFVLRGMRPHYGGRFGALVLNPIAADEFLNVRTYVRHDGETGIYFLAEWLSNRLSVALGPPVFGLPYRLGQLDYQHDDPSKLTGRVADARGEGVLEYEAGIDGAPRARPCEPGSLDEWLMERYTAFTCVGGKSQFFRVWHPPWPQTRAAVEVGDQSLLNFNWPFFRTARIAFANFSPGVKGVWMGWPHRLALQPALLLRRTTDRWPGGLRI